MEILQITTELSHEFGTSAYVRGGGGNTSCKDEQVLWVKPSGTTLVGLTPESFVALDRKKLSELYTMDPPSDSSAREALVKTKMENAVLSETSGRASVEAPLHDSLNACFVVHTHPFIVNGLTCAKNGKAVCNELFPAALWLDYVDPGYTLCMQVRKEIQRSREKNGVEPAMIFLKNHGVFIAADEPEEIRHLYAEVTAKLKARYQQANISLELDITEKPEQKQLSFAEKIIRNVMQNPDLFVAASGAFEVVAGPITPDHIVYSKSYPFTEKPTVDRVDAFKMKYGYTPQVFAFNDAVFGVSNTDNGAKLALELAQDGALVQKLADAFGGIEYLTDRARKFIENWEVESYRKKQMET